ncbi:glycosyltransferase [Bacillus rhizoplanae]|uniref:glycosyltransferase n=1 Tax=Bacillus rhizoplanae TaxID=2880966 RepID=UPI003D1A1442
MKIAYIFRNNSVKLDGVNKKVLNTVLEWRKLNIDAKIFVLVDNEQKVLEEYKIHSNFIEIIRFKNMIDFVINKNLLSTISNWHPDAIYVRGIDIYFSSSARNLLKSHKVVQEIHTNDVTERKEVIKESVKKMKLSKILTNSLYLLFRDQFLKNVAGVVVLNNELKKILPPGLPMTVIGDGINLDIGSLSHNKSSYTCSEYNIVFMGTHKHPWYGLEKVIKIANYIPNCNFHIIGLEEQDFKEYHIVNNNIKFHGFLDTKAYQSILQMCDVAIGSLSLYENNMTEGSPLKGREYLAFGLPCIIGYKDTDFFDRTPEFLLELPSSPRNVDDNLDRIKDFILRAKSIVINKEDIKHLDYSVKEKKRINFIQSLIED